MVNEDGQVAGRLQRRDLQLPRPALHLLSARVTSSAAPPTPRCWSTATSSSARSSSPSASRACSPSRSSIAARASSSLARDRFGIKPLYLRRDAAAALVRLGDPRLRRTTASGRPRVDPAFMQLVPALGYVPSPGTAFRDVVKLPPGTVLEIDLDTGEETATKYYELRPAEHRGHAPTSELVERAARAAQRRGRAPPHRRRADGDLPLGRPRLERDRHFRQPSQRAPLATFSMGFSSSDRGDEIGFAAARRRDARATRTCASIWRRHALGDLDPIVERLEEPLSDSAVLPLWYLCAGTGAHVKVALSGEGGDEVLGGYGALLLGRRRRPAQPLGDRLAARWSSRLADLVCRRARWARSTSCAAPASSRTRSSFAEQPRYLSWFDIFTPAEQRALCGEEAIEPAAHVERLFDDARTTWRSTTCSGCSTSTSTPCCSTTCS